MSKKNNNQKIDYLKISSDFCNQYSSVLSNQHRHITNNNQKPHYFLMFIAGIKYFFDNISKSTSYTKYNNQTNNDLEKQMKAYGLNESEKKLVREGKQSIESFDTDDSSDEDDYYHEDDE